MISSAFGPTTAIVFSLPLRQGQQAVVLQQDDRRLRDAPREPVVLRRLVHASTGSARSARARAGRTCPSLMRASIRRRSGDVDISLGDQPLVQRAAAAPCRSLPHSRSQPLVTPSAAAASGGGHDLVALVDVVDGAAVGDDVAVEAPVLAQDVLEQALARRGGLAVDAVVGAHHRGDARPPGPAPGTRAGRSRTGRARWAARRRVALRLGAAVDREVLGASRPA